MRGKALMILLAISAAISALLLLVNDGGIDVAKLTRFSLVCFSMGYLVNYLWKKKRSDA